jgi:hypothetical protein
LECQLSVDNRGYQIQSLKNHISSSCELYLPLHLLNIVKTMEPIYTNHQRALGLLLMRQKLQLTRYERCRCSEYTVIVGINTSHNNNIHCTWKKYSVIVIFYYVFLIKPHFFKTLVESQFLFDFDEMFTIKGRINVVLHCNFNLIL